MRPNSVISFVRKGKATDDVILVRVELHPGVRGRATGSACPAPGYWTEMLNTDAGRYGGSNVGNTGGVYAEFVPMHNQRYSVVLNLPPLGGIFFKGRQ